MTGTFSRADSCRSVTKCFIWGQTFVDVLISLFFYTFISLSSKSYLMKFFLQFLTLVHNYKRCRNSCFHIQLVRSQGIQNYAMLPERYTPQALFNKLNLEYLTIFKNNIENIKVIFLNNISN